MAFKPKSRANVPEEAVEEVKEEQTDLFGFEAEYDDELGEFKTISGKIPRDLNLDNATAYNIQDFDISNTINGYPEVTIFKNEKKDENGKYERNYQSVRLRLIDHDEYVDLYANIPRMDEKGFIQNLNSYFDFFRGGFDLVFSFMRWVDETNVYTSDGETINNIKMVNIENICKKIDTMEYVKVKVIKGAKEEYPSWIILDMKENI